MINEQSIVDRAGVVMTNPAWNGTSDLVAVPAGTSLAAGAVHVFDVEVRATLPADQVSTPGGWSNTATVSSGTALQVDERGRRRPRHHAAELQVTKTVDRSSAEPERSTCTC